METTHLRGDDNRDEWLDSVKIKAVAATIPSPPAREVQLLNRGAVAAVAKEARGAARVAVGGVAPGVAGKVEERGQLHLAGKSNTRPTVGAVGRHSKEAIVIILMVSDNTAPLAPLAAAFEQRPGIEVRFAAGGNAALAFLRQSPTDLVVIDQQLDGASGIAFAKVLVKAHPLVNTAIVGTLDEESFHQATEGLGVLMQLSPASAGAEVERILAVLSRIGTLLQPAGGETGQGGRS